MAGRRLALDGRTPGTTPSLDPVTTSDWFSEGVGEVQYSSSDLFQLVGHGRPTPTAQASWSAVKRRFH